MSKQRGVSSGPPLGKEASVGKVTAVGMDLITKGSGHTCTGMAVSVCLTPAAPSPLPIPYPTVGSVSEGLMDVPMRTKAGGEVILTVGGVMSKCHGNEPGTLKEVLSLNTAGPCFPVMGAPTVFIELGMAGITGSPGFMNKGITVGLSSAAGGSAGGGGAGGGGGGGGGSQGGGGSGPGGGGGGGGGSGSGSGGGGGPGAGPAGGPGKKNPEKPGESSGGKDKHTCQNGHPVDVVAGTVVDQATDISLGGPIPLVFQRFYSSERSGDRTATLGAGWAHGFEQRITEQANGTLLLREGEGRLLCFANPKPKEEAFHRRERLSLTRAPSGELRVFNLETRLTQVFAPADSSQTGPSAPALLRKIEDAWGNTAEFRYQGSRLATITDSTGRVLRLTWKDHRISSLQVEGGPSSFYEYSPEGYLIKAADGAGAVETYEYDALGRMIATTTKGGVRFTYEYNAEGRCKATTGPKGLFGVKFEYDLEKHETQVISDEPRVLRWNKLGLAEQERLPDGSVLEEVAYDEDGHRIAKANGAGEGFQYWYDERGNLTRIRDQNNLYRDLEYKNDLLVSEKAPDGQVTRYAYDAAGALCSVVYPTGAGYQFGYDARGHLEKVYGPKGLLSTFEYDAQHNLIAETDARGSRTTYSYDVMGRPITQRDALGQETRVTYDGMGRRTSITSPDGTTTRFSYDGMGRLTGVTNPLGQVTKFAYSGMAALTQVVRPDGRKFELKYNAYEKLLQILNPLGEKYEYVRDPAGRVIRETTFDQRELKYEYNVAGNLSRVAYPDGSWRAFAYERASRLVLEETPEGKVELNRDLHGRLVSTVSDSWGERVVTQYERDQFGRVVAEIQGDNRVNYTLDSEGRRIERVLPNGARTLYGYDAAGVLEGLQHDDTQLNFERDALGREVKRGNQGGLTIASRYDAADRLLEQRVTAPVPGEAPRLASQRKWKYDRAGRVEQIEDGRWGTTTYKYDPAGRLLESKQAGLHETFQYDGADSIIGWLEKLGDSAQTTQKAEVAPGNLLLKKGGTEYRYDARGRRVAKIEADGRATEYLWDSRDRLRRVKLPGGTEIGYVYDAFGRRVMKLRKKAEGKVEATHFFWDGEVLALEADDVKGTRAFVHFPGSFEPLLQQQNGEVFLSVNDHLGMPKDLVAADGVVAWSATHSAFGKVVRQGTEIEGQRRYGGAVESPFRLLGQIADDDVGLTFTRFRCFDAEVGRWVSPDPLEVAGSANLFGFDGPPTRVVDPLGLTTEGGTPHRKVFLDENVYFMEDDLKKAGFHVEKVPSGTLDPEVRALVESQNGILVTRNYKDFKGMQGVVRVSGTNPLAQQTATTITSLNQVQDKPGLWDTCGGQAPASGFNKGHLKQVK